MAAFNRKVTNKAALLVASHLPGFGVVTHTGRKSGATYRTPVNVFHRDGRLRFALTYGRGDWVRNVLAGGPASVRTVHGTFPILTPVIVTDTEHRGLPGPVRLLLRLTDTTEELQANDGTATAPA
jgi:deazaflavin-dependent oxidoreductase (nitroreductase family)